MRSILFAVLTFFCRVFYKMKIEGTPVSVQADGPPVMYTCNHVSFFDAMFVACVVPKGTPFVVYGPVARGIVCRFLKLIGFTLIPVETSSPHSVKTMVKALTDPNGTRSLVIFPEGRLTTTGGMMTVQPGAGLVAAKSNALIVPMHLQNAEYLKRNRLAGLFAKRFRPNITMTIGSPAMLPDYSSETPRVQREKYARFLERMLMETGLGDNRNLLTAFLDARHYNGKNKVIIEDVRDNKLSYKSLLRMAIAAGRFASSGLPAKQNIGVLLPNSGVTIATMFGISFYGDVFLPLNFTSGVENLVSVCRTAEVKRVVSSHGFIAKAGLEAVEQALIQSGVELIYAEDMAKISFFEKMKILLTSWMPKRMPGFHVSAQDTMVILSTSGSEGAPKCVCLSHANMMTNIQQVLRTIDVTPADRFLNAMPVFHSFGLMGGVLLPVLRGAWSYQYPSPLHGRNITAICYGHNITITFATNTFLNIWASHATPQSFYKMRAIVAGAEKVTDKTRQLYSEKFGVKVLEGYGATEASPVLGLNTFIHNKPGSIGHLLPGIAMTLESVPGMDGKRLKVAGPNIMQGYLKAEAPGVLVPSDGEYDTGDIVEVDGNGFVTISGRAKRFAKIAGEMVSLGSSEMQLENALASRMAEIKNSAGPAKASLFGSAVVAIPDEKKGEKLIALVTMPEAELLEIKGEVQSAMSAQGATELQIPKVFVSIERLPLLGTGKVNYPELMKNL